MPSIEVIAIAFAILIWLISSLIKGLRWLGKQLRGTNARPSLVQQAAAEAQRQAAGGRPPGPAAGPLPDPVRYKTSVAFVSQDDALRAEETLRRGVPLTFPAAPPRAAQAAPLFGGTDDLVRAIILQEVLGPPLSRRSEGSPPA